MLVSTIKLSAQIRKRAKRLPPTLHKMQPLTAIKFQRLHLDIDGLDTIQVETEYYQS